MSGETFGHLKTLIVEGYKQIPETKEELRDLEEILFLMIKDENLPSYKKINNVIDCFCMKVLTWYEYSTSHQFMTELLYEIHRLVHYIAKVKNVDVKLIKNNIYVNLCAFDNYFDVDESGALIGKSVSTSIHDKFDVPECH